MAYKYQRFSDLLYTNYSGLQTLGFAFAKGKKIGGRVVLVQFVMFCFDRIDRIYKIVGCTQIL